MEYITKNSEETYALAKEFSKKLKSGDTVLLLGEMGVGKTVFTKGVCDGLGVDDYITSPTFTIVNEYEGKNLPVYHFDLYRLEDESELFEVGFEEYLTGGGVCIIEWPQIAYGIISKKRYTVEIKKTENLDERKIILSEI